MFQVYKPGQAKLSRTSTFLIGLFLIWWGCLAMMLHLPRLWGPLDDSFKTDVLDAMKVWNDALSETDWKFVEAGPAPAPVDVIITELKLDKDVRNEVLGHTTPDGEWLRSMTIEIATDANGCTMITLTDEARFGRRPRGLAADNILVRASDGACFTARPNLPGLERLSAPEVEMVEFYLREVDGACEANVFAGDTPPGD